jgi:hypothetical protein
MELTLGPRRIALVAALAAAFLAPGASLAQKPADATQEAQRLFVEGREAVARGDRKAGCAKFRASLALAAVPNTIFNVAQCDEQDGRLLQALARWRQGLSLLAEGDERLNVAKQRSEDVERRIPRLVLRLAPDAPPGSRVLVDGAEIGPTSLGTPVSVDPGERSVVVEAPGRQAQRASVRVAEGDRRELELTAGPASSVVEAPPPPPPGGGDVRRTLGFVAGGIGVAGFVVAGVTGGMLVSRNAEIEGKCPNKVCSSDGKDAIDSTGPLFTANTIGWVAGIAGVSAGVGLLLWSSGGKGDPPSTAVAPAVLPGGGGALVMGRF